MAGDLFRAFYKAMTDRSYGGEQRMRTMLSGLERDHGSVRAAAADAGVSESTWRRWKRGESKPRPENVDKVKRARRRRRPDRQRAARGSTGPGGGLSVTGWVVVSQDERKRTLALGPVLGPGRLDAIVDAFLNAEDDDMVEAMVQELVNDYIRSGNGPGGYIVDAVIRFG